MRGYIAMYQVSQAVAFVRHPSMRGVYLKVHPCVLFVACPFCKRKIGEPCWGRGGYVAYAHISRRATHAQKERK